MASGAGCMGRPLEAAHNHNKLCVFLGADDRQIASRSVHIYTQMPFQRKKKKPNYIANKLKAG